MFDFVQHYSSSKSKLFDFGIEVLYAFTLLFFAGQLYGKEISIDALLSGAKTVSIDFFQDVIGISLAYLLIAIIVQVAVMLVMFGSDELIYYIGYRRYKKRLKVELKETFTFEKYKKQPESKELYDEAAYRVLGNLNEKQFIRGKDYYLEKKATTQSSRIFIILTSYLIIDLGFRQSNFGVMNWIILPGLILIVLFHVYAAELEHAVSNPDFFLKLDRRSTLSKLRQLVLKDQRCFQRISKKERGTIKENVFFVHNKNHRLVGWIIIVDQEMMETSFIESILKKGRSDKGSFKILLDPFDLIPDSYSSEENMEIVKSVDDFNLGKRVNGLLFK